MFGSFFKLCFFRSIFVSSFDSSGSQNDFSFRLFEKTFTVNYGILVDKRKGRDVYSEKIFQLKLVFSRRLFRRIYMFHAKNKGNEFCVLKDVYCIGYSKIFSFKKSSFLLLCISCAFPPFP